MRLIERSDIRFSQTDWKTNQQMNVCYSRVAFSIEQAEKLKSREMKGGWMKNVEGWWFEAVEGFWSRTFVIVESISWPKYSVVDR